jgi:thioredoxin-related protein
MKNDSNNQIPIFKFLAKHKWRIILPFLFALFYWAIPRYQTNNIAVQQELFIKSPVLSQNEITSKCESIKNSIYSEDNLRNILTKYNLYKTEKEQNNDERVFIQKLKNAINVSPRDWEVVDGIQVHVWIYLKEENSEHIT